MVSQLPSFTREDYERGAEKRMLIGSIGLVRDFLVSLRLIGCVVSIIPKPDRRIGHVMFIAERTEARYI